MAASAITQVDPGLAEQFEKFLDSEDGLAPEAEKPEADETPDEGGEDEPDEEPVPASSEQDSEESEGDEETQDSEESEDDEREVINTFAELAQSFEVDESDLLDHLQIEGTDGEMVPLSAALEAYRNGPNLTESFNVELEKTRKELREQNAQAVSNLEQVTARLIQKIENHREPEGGWSALRQRDPAEYIRLREEQDADRADAEAALRALEQNSAAQKEAYERRHAEYIQEQADKVYRLKPEWRDPEKGKAAFDEIQNYLEHMGFPTEQIDNLEDALSIVTVWKAAQYDKLESQKPEIKKRLRRLPVKHMGTTARRENAPKEAQQKARNAALNRFRKSGRIEDGLQFFEEHVD